MEPWKIGVIAAMLAGLVGFGLYNQSSTQTQNSANPAKTSILPAGTPKPSAYTGSTLLTKQLPEWGNIKQWLNTPSPIPLASLKGKVALIEVFRTECSHCQEASPFMEAVYDRYKSRGLQIVALQSPGDTKDPQNPENNWATVKTWVTQHGLKYPIGFDEKSAWFQGKVPGEKLYPTMMLTDKTGKISFSQTGFDQDKAIFLAVAIEKALPTSKPVEERAKDLAEWLIKTFQWPGSDDAATKKDIIDGLTEMLKK